MADLVMNAGADVDYTVGSVPPAVNLTSAAANIGDGTVLTAVQWSIVCAPEGHNATLVNADQLSGAQLIGIDDGIIGDFVLALVGTNDAAQTSEQVYRDMPDSAVIVIGVRTAYANLSIPSLDQKGYHEKVNAWALRIDSNYQRLEALQVTTGGNFTGVEGKLNELRLYNTFVEEYTGVISGAADLDTGLRLETTDEKILELRHLDSDPDHNATLRVQSGHVAIFGAAASDVDLRTNRVGPFSNNTGIEFYGRGSHTFDAAMAIAKVGAIIENVLDAGIDIDGVLVKDSRPRSSVGNSSIKRPPVANLGSSYLGIATPGTTLVSLANYQIPPNALAVNGGWHGVAFYDTAASTDNKRFVITVEGETIWDETGPINDLTFSVDVWIFRTGTNTQLALVQRRGAGFSDAVLATPLTRTESVANRVYFGAQSTVTGDITLLAVVAQYQDDLIT